MLMQKQGSSKQETQQEKETARDVSKMEIIEEPIDEGTTNQENKTAEEKDPSVQKKDSGFEESKEPIEEPEKDESKQDKKETVDNEKDGENEIKDAAREEQTDGVEKMVSDKEQKCPVLKELAETGEQEITSNVNSVTQEAAKALINLPAKETCKKCPPPP